MIFNGSPDERDIIIAALEQYVDNLRDDIAETGDEGGDDDRTTHLTMAEQLHHALLREGGYK